MFRSMFFIYVIVFSFVLSSCDRQLEQNNNFKSLISSSEDQTVEDIYCDEKIYGNDCDNLENFVLVKKDEVKPEYIKLGFSIGGIEGTLAESDEDYVECIEDGQLGCLSTETYKAINITNHTSKIISTADIFGEQGSFVIPSSNEIFAGTSYGVDGALSGALPYCNENDSGCYLKTYGVEDSPLKALDYDDISSKKSNIKNGVEIVSGITGTQPVCSDGGSNCYIDGNSFKAVESDKLIAANIKNGVTLGLVTGSYVGDYLDCSSTSHVGCVAVSDYPSVPATLTSSLLSSASINGIPGSIEDCSAGDSLCYINGSSFKAVETSSLLASNIKKDISLGGVTGEYPSESYPLTEATNTTDLVASNFNSLIVSDASFEWFDASGNRYTGTGDIDIVATNIRKDVDIFGVVGSYGDPIPTNKGVGNCRALAFKKKDNSVMCFGNDNYGGSCYDLEGVVDVFSTTWCGAGASFAALKSNGSVSVWGGGDASYPEQEVLSSLSSGVVTIFSSGSAFAALKDNGSVVTWGSSYGGGDSSSVSASLSSGVTDIFSTGSAFAALKSDGSVITWGDSNYGGDSSSVSASLSSGIVNITSTSNSFGGAFAALKSNGSVVTWGNSSYGGDSSSVSSQLSSGVEKIYSNAFAFVAVKSNGSVVTWGDSYSGGDSSSVQEQLVNIINVVPVLSSYDGAFAALKSNGTVVTWGNSSYGGDSSSVQEDLVNVVNIYSTDGAFAALKSDGSVVAWGDSYYGGDASSVQAQLTGITKIFSNSSVFVALKSDGTVVAWGDSSDGGDTSSVLEYTGSSSVSGIVNVFSSDKFFMGVREDESYVIWGSNPVDYP